MSRSQGTLLLAPCGCARELPRHPPSSESRAALPDRSSSADSVTMQSPLVLDSSERSTGEESEEAGRPFTVREQVLWTIFGLVLLLSFLVLLIDDQLV